MQLQANMTADIVAELRNIRTINLAHKAANLGEKILWALIGIIGTAWAIYFMTFLVFQKYFNICYVFTYLDKNNCLLRIYCH